MEVIGYFCAILMGGTLGLIGGGGSILTVPILLYLFMLPPVEATAYSLFTVGLTSLVGSIDYFKRELIDFKIGAIFAVPSIIGVYLTRRYGVPAIPEKLSLNNYIVAKDDLIIFLFAIIMLIASFSMIKKRVIKKKGKLDLKKLILISFEGLAVGSVTGLIGAGGGFLIIPALVLFAGLDMKVAVGTSLIIIGVKSLIGFLGDIQVQEFIDWSLLFSFSGLSILGMFGGIFLSRKITNEQLKPAFGWFVLLMSFYILGKEFLIS